METDSFDKKTPISEYNEAVNQITRLNNLWLDCHRYSRAGNYNDWNFTLDRIWNELYADAVKKNEKKYKKEWFFYSGKVFLARGNKNKIYLAMQNKEQFLRKLQDDVGKGSKRQDTYEDIMI